MFRVTSCMNVQERQPVRIVWNPSANGNDGGEALGNTLSDEFVDVILGKDSGVIAILLGARRRNRHAR
jgi:hypothetical protein